MISESYKFTVIRADKLDLDVRLRKYPKYLQRDLRLSEAKGFLQQERHTEEK